MESAVYNGLFGVCMCVYVCLIGVLVTLSPIPNFKKKIKVGLSSPHTPHHSNPLSGSFANLCGRLVDPARTKHRITTARTLSLNHGYKTFLCHIGHIHDTSGDRE